MKGRMMRYRIWSKSKRTEMKEQFAECKNRNRSETRIMRN